MPLLWDESESSWDEIDHIGINLTVLVPMKIYYHIRSVNSKQKNK